MRRECRYIALAAAVAMFSGTAAAQDQQPRQEQQAERGNETGAWADSLAYDEYLAGQELRASELIDAPVQNQQGQELGRVEDLVVSKDDDVVQAVIAVGGVLGVGEKLIAVPYDELRVSRDGETLFLARTREQVEALPEFQREERAAAGAEGAATQRRAAAQQLAVEQQEEGGAPGQQLAAQQQEQQRAAQEQQAERQAGQQAQQAAQQEQEAQRQAREARQDAEQSEQQAEQAEQQAQQAGREAERAGQEASSQREAQAEQQQRSRPSTQVTVMDRSDRRASELIGLTVVDSRGEEVGEIDDLVVSPEDGKIFAVLAVGGVIGIGERLISVPLEDLELSRPDVEPREPGVAGQPDANEARINMTSEQLIETQPEFQYSTDERTANVG